MKEQVAHNILRKMEPDLSGDQMIKLQYVLKTEFNEIVIKQREYSDEEYETANILILNRFINAKRLEGCSERTLASYEFRLKKFITSLEKPLRNVTTEDIRTYFQNYKEQSKGIVNSSLDNIRLYLSSFFTWMSNESLIYSNPMTRIPRFKSEKVIRKPFSEEEVELLRMATKTERDLAILEFLYSTGVRVHELEALNKNNINFDTKECIVFGKGAKERIVYLNAKAVVHLKKYLDSRRDGNKALFVSKKYPYNRLMKPAYEAMIRDLGKRAGVENCHPHRFRRTMATNALNRGMPIQEVRDLMGHTKIDTTMIYADLSKDNIKLNHRRYIN